MNSGSQGTFLDGCHSAIFLLGSGSLTTSPGWTRQCLQAYLRSCRRCRSGLASCHLALVAEPSHPLLASSQVQLGVWSPMRQLVSRTPRPARRRWDRGRGRGRKTAPRSPPLVDIHLDYSQLVELISSLDSVGESGGDTHDATGSLKPQDRPPSAEAAAPQDTARTSGETPNTSPEVTVALQDAPLDEAAVEKSEAVSLSTQLQNTVSLDSGVSDGPAVHDVGSQSTEPLVATPVKDCLTQYMDVRLPSTRPQVTTLLELATTRTDPESEDGAGLTAAVLGSAVEHREAQQEQAPPAEGSLASGEVPGREPDIVRSKPTAPLQLSSSVADDVLAGQIHSLLDTPPWSPEENSVIDVHWLLGEDPLPYPSSQPALTGALLRLRLWHNTHLQIVTTDIPREKEGSCREEWYEVGEAGVVSVDQWTHGLEDIWRGNLHFTERRTAVKQASRETVVFPGFSLSLLPQNPLDDTTTSSPSPPLDDDVATPHSDVITSASAVLRDVGLPWGSVPPTHLEVIQLLDISTVPLFWFSPFTCSLSLHNKSHEDSASLFPELLQKKGLLVRLCYADEEGKAPGKHRTTSDWLKHLQSLEEDDINNRTSHSPLAAYELGPVLAVSPSRGEETSCHACFLWTPDAINPSPFLNLQRIKPESVRSFKELSLKLPIVSLSEDGQSAAVDGEFDLGDLTSSELLEEFCSKAPTHNPALDVEPSEWPEIKALATYEWLQKKLVRRPMTPDLMFGQMVAPPPSSSSSSAGKTCLNVEDVLECFHDTGSPATSELSPITHDTSDVAKVVDPNASGKVPSFETIAAGTPRSKKRYHGVNYCLEPEDSVIDARLTRIQQRYLLSERASNCSSSNTPEVKLEQRRRRRLRRGEAGPAGGGGAGETGRGGGKGMGKEGRKQEVKEKGMDFEREGGRVGGRRGGGKVGRRLVVDGGVGDVTEEVERLALTVKEGEGGEGGGGSGRTCREPMSGVQQQEEEVLCRPADSTTPSASGASAGVSLHRSPVVRLHRVETPPSTSRPPSLPGQLLARDTTSAPLTAEQQQQYHTESDPASAIEDKSLLELNPAVVDGPDTGKEEPASGHCVPLVRRSPRKKIELSLKEPVVQISREPLPSSSGTGGLQRSPRKNKWVGGQRPLSGGQQQSASDRNRSNKKKLEQVVVAALKKQGMKRDHVCFRKCYTRLFNLSKSFLKDVRSSRDLVAEMHRVVDFNVSQVMDFELRQARTTL